MPKGQRKIKSFYIDTNIALDYITGRNRQTISVLDKIRDKGWKCISSSFLAMELADYKKDSLFVLDKVIEKKWEMRKILRETYKKDLKRGDFEKIYDWFTDFKQSYKNLELYDFLTDSHDWQFAQEISFNSNLSASDVIHLFSAISSAFSKNCRVMITSDHQLITEGQKILDNYKLNSKLKIMKISDVDSKFFVKKTRKSGSNLKDETRVLLKQS